ncbi:MAG: hypothetical protein WBD36_09390 [Bacteroidota bacterium]
MITTLNWKLIVQLSFLGLAMGIATVFWIPSTIEPFFWLAIFLVCAYVFAIKNTGKLFLHGFLVSIVNSIWITSLHVLLFDSYIARHPEEAAMMTRMPLPDSPRTMMIITGPIIGVVSGLVLGLFCLVAGKLVAKKG